MTEPPRFIPIGACPDCEDLCEPWTEDGVSCGETPGRYLSPALRAELAKWPPMPTYQDSAGGLTPTPLRAYSPAQQLLLKSPVPASIQAKRAKVGRERG